MTGSELTQALRRIDWQKADLARRLQVNANTVSNWVRDGAPDYVSAYVGTLLALHAIVEAPRRADKRANVA